MLPQQKWRGHPGKARCQHRGELERRARTLGEVGLCPLQREVASYGRLPLEELPLRVGRHLMVSDWREGKPGSGGV